MSAFMDDKDMRLHTSPSGLLHVDGWFGETVCGKWIAPEWTYKGLTSLRWLGRISRRPQANRMCKSCAHEYKDVDIDAY